MDANGYNPSIMQADLTHCFLCRRTDRKLDRHEVFHGAYRQKSKRLGLWVMLCHDECHLGGAHKDAAIDRELKKGGQRAVMKIYGWSVPDVIRELGKNYL